MKDTSVAIIIPTRNGSSTLRELLELVKQQTFVVNDIYIVDSSSEDDTVAVAEDYGATVVIIDQADFDHGGTRSMMAEKVAADILVYFTQDALPATRDALEQLLLPLLSNPEVGVSYGRQLPLFEAQVSARQLRKFNYPDFSEIRSFEDRQRLGLKTAFCSNSFAAYRRSVLEQVDFFQSGLIFGEDSVAVGKILQKGFNIAYCSDAKVYHSHDYEWLEEFKRSFDIGVLHTSENWLLKVYGQAEGVGIKFVKTQINNLWQERCFVEIMDCIIRSGCKYVGYKLGRRYNMLPFKFVVGCSMNPSWWHKRKK